MSKHKSEIAKYKEGLVKTLTEDLADLDRTVLELDLQLKQNMGAKIYVQMLLKKLNER